MVYFLIISAGLVWYLFFRKKSKPNNSVVLNVSTSYNTSSYGEGIKVKYIQNGDTSFTIGTNLNFPLNLQGIKKDEVEQIVSVLSTRSHYQIKEWFTYLVAKNNIRCKEIVDWVNESRDAIIKVVNERIQLSQEWKSASELDKKDILVEVRNDVLTNFDVRPASIDAAWGLIFEEPKDDTLDDKLLSQFNGDSSTYQTLVHSISYGNRVLVVSADDYRRKKFETLAEMGFFNRGQEISIENILETTTLKVMQEMAGSDAPKKFTRKQQAVDFLKTLPDIKQRLEKVVSFRELFQIKPIEGVDIEEIKKSYQHARHVADIILDTLATSVDSEQTKNSSLFEWTMHSEDCCPSCRSKNGKAWKRVPKNLPPYHIGCTASIF